MGLAASQARFLAITARKMNCEFQSMQIAQEKLSTTRDLQRAAMEYQNSLDATKLVWDTENGETFDLSYDLMMRPSTINEFTPYIITDTQGKAVLSEEMFQAAVKAGLIDQNGDPTFNRTYIDSNGDTRTNSYRKPSLGEIDSTDDGSRNAFLYQLGQYNQINGTMAKEIISLGEDGYTRSGIGGPIFDKSTANALTTNLFINYLKDAKSEDVVTVKPGYEYGYNVVNDTNDGYKYTTTESVPSDATSNVNLLVLHYPAGKKIDRDIYYECKKDGDGNFISQTAEKTGTINGTTYKVGDTLPDVMLFKKGDIAPCSFTVAIQTVTEANGYVYGVSNAVQNVFATKDSSGVVTDSNNAVSTASEKLIDKKFTITQNGKSLSDKDLESLTLGDILSGQYEITYNSDNSNSTDALSKFEQVLEEFAKVLGYGNSTHIVGLNVDKESDDALNLAFKYTKRLLDASNMTYVSTTDPAVLNSNAQSSTNVIASSKTDTYSMSLTNLMASFLTNFARAIDGLNTSYFVNEKSIKESNLVTKDLDYYFILANDGSLKDEIDLNADFYNMLYNVISTMGACTDEMLRNQVIDNSMLHNAIKNGRMFVSSLNTDGYFYQGAYSLTDFIVEVPDEDAIVRAELEYEATKSQLNTKEETLELKMKNLDMEISALTTEFDTVKNLISKNVEKVFNLFNS